MNTLLKTLSEQLSAMANSHGVVNATELPYTAGVQNLLREAAVALEAAEKEASGRKLQMHEYRQENEFMKSERTRLQARLVAVEAAARHAKSQAAAPDYDEEAIRNALWAVVEAALASLPTEETA